MLIFANRLDLFKMKGSFREVLSFNRLGLKTQPVHLELH